MSAALHREGRAALLQAWPIVTGAPATLPELQIAGAVANLESAYGTATFRNRHVFTDENGISTFDTPGDPVTGTFNVGSVQCGHLPPCGAGCFEATDSSPAKITASNPSGLYQACFVLAATMADGMRTFIKQITTQRPLSWAAMRAGDIDAFSDAMHREHYYEGFGATVADRINNHAHAVDVGVHEIAAAMGEPIAATRGGAGASSGIEVADVAAGIGVLTLGYLGGRELARRVNLRGELARLFGRASR
jgi:hypothetical protein